LTGPDRRALQITARIFTILLALNCVSLVFAGIWFVSESLIQLMFWRFSIYLKLLSCVAVAYLICDTPLLSRRARLAILWSIPLILSAGILAAFSIESKPHPGWLDIALKALGNHRSSVILFAGLAYIPALASSRHISPRTPAAYLGGMLACVIIVVIGWNRWLGWGMTPEPVDADYLKLCHWAREATPLDAVFLVPPSDTAFRLEARRAIVVDFKHVPQLSGEMVVWLDRLENVLGTHDIDSFPRDYTKLLPALDACYEARPAKDLIAVARRYDARYIVVEHDLGPDYRNMLIYRSGSGRGFVYDLQR
jgi:hypothetical protein